MAAMPDSPVTVFLAADDGFCRPLAVTIRSIVAKLTAGRELDLYVCDMGISPRNKALIGEVAAHPLVSQADRLMVAVWLLAVLGLPRLVPVRGTGRTVEANEQEPAYSAGSA